MVKPEGFGNKGKLPDLAGAKIFRDGGSRVGGISPVLAAFLSLLSWPEPDCPDVLKPIMVVVATAFWFGLMAVVTIYGPPLFRPVFILPLGLVFLLCGFVGGSVIAIFTSVAYALAIYFDLFTLRLPEVTMEIVSSGYRHKDFIMLTVFAWLCGVAHWRRRFSWRFAIIWGLIVVFTPLIHILVNIYVFYGNLPAKAVERLLNHEFLIAWGLTVLAAALIAKILYLFKDFLCRVFS